MQTVRGLIDEERATYWRDGYVGPFRALDHETVARIRDDDILPLIGADAKQIGPTVHCRHLDSRSVFDLCALPAITDRISSLLGPDLVLWRSHLWCKQPGDGEVPWHQDLTYWPLEPLVSISAWLALEPATVGNACVQVIPGSHHVVAPTEPITGDPLEDRLRQDCVDEERAVDVELDAGEFFLFSARLVHRSGVNRSGARRLGLTVRVTVPMVKVAHQRLFPGHKNMLLRGEDRLHLNEMQDPPAAETLILA